MENRGIVDHCIATVENPRFPLIIGNKIPKIIAQTTALKQDLVHREIPNFKKGVIYC